MDSGDLAGTTWTLLQFETDGGMVPPVPDAPATMAFTADSEQGAGAPINHVSGTGGCNRYVGSYTLTGDRLTVGQVVATRMLCTPPERMAQEDRFFRALNTAATCELRDGHLLITYAGGTLHLARAATHQSS